MHSLVSVVDIQLVLQHLFPLKSEADVSAAIKAVSSANQITISALMPIHRYGLITSCLLDLLPKHLATLDIVSDILCIIHSGCIVSM